MYPRSNCMPSTTSSEVSVVFDSSTVITPSFPTRSMASAISSPIFGSLWAEIVATCARSSRLWTGRDWARSDAIAAWSPRSKPRFSSTALAPATTFRIPSERSAWASSVDVLVPSPTCSPVRSAAWRMIWAPRFSAGSSRAISFAMVTPSLQTMGAPNRRSMSTHLDRGPRVTRTASVSAVAPRTIFSRASEWKSTFLWVMAGSSSRKSRFARGGIRPCQPVRSARDPRAPPGIPVPERSLHSRWRVRT
jgi:hypothetical protein